MPAFASPALASPVVSDPSAHSLALAPLRLLDPPEPARVERAAPPGRDPLDVPPAVVWWREQRLVVAHAHGPERLSGDWWEDAFRRDYWRCRTEAGELLVFLDRAAANPAWYVQGWYD